MAKLYYQPTIKMLQTDVDAGAINAPTGAKILIIDGTGALTGQAYEKTPTGVLSTSGVKNNYSASAVPTVSNDSTQGYSIGSRWIFNNESYLCVNATAGAANWQITTADAISEIAGLQPALDAKVDKIVGKGLSTNDYTTAEQTKLAGIATGATAVIVENVLTSTNIATALSAAQGNTLQTTKEAIANKGIANGYAGLDATGVLTFAQRPILTTTTTTSIAPILGAKVGFPGYRMCKLIPINSTTTGSGDYQVELNIGESITATGFDFHLGGNSQNFPSAQKQGGEFKFVLPDGTDIPFFVASVTGTTPNRIAKVFLRLSGLTGQTSTIQKLVFMLYNNNLYSVPSQMSSIASVFNILADDFDAATLDTTLWVGTGVTLASSIATLAAAGSTLHSLATTYGDSMEIIVYKQIGSTTGSYTGNIGFTNNASGNIVYGSTGNQVGYFWDWGATGTAGYKWTIDATYTTVTNPSTTTFGLYRVARYGGAARGIYPAGTNTAATGVFVGNGTAVVDGEYGNSGYVDWVAVRQYLAVAPTIGIIQDV